MGTTADNVARLAYTKWHETKGKNEQVWLDLMADNIRMLSLADGAPGVEFTSEMRSKEDFRRYLEGLRDGWEMIHYTTRDFIAEGERVAVLGSTSWRNRKTGKEVSTPKADFVVFRDGNIVEFYEFYDTAKIMAAVQG